MCDFSVFEFYVEKIFLVDDVYFAGEVESAFADEHASHFSRDVVESDYFLGEVVWIEGDFHLAFVVALCGVWSEVDLCFEAAVEGEASAFDE